MTRSTLLVAWLAVGCGRLGFDSIDVRGGAGGTATGGAGSFVDAGTNEASLRDTGAREIGGASGANSGGAGAVGAGGAIDGGFGGTTDAGSGGTVTGGVGGTGTGGAGGTGAAGSDGGPCTPTNGGVEICDGRDNDCNGTIDEAGCPTRCSGRAYGGHGYMYCINSNLYWDGCHSACIAAGMDFIVVGSAGENSFVGQWVASKHGSAWLGATDEVTEGTWLWADRTQFWSGDFSGSAVGGAFTFWASGQPDNGGTSGPDSDCLMIATSGLWYDQRCADFVDYICEAP